MKATGGGLTLVEQTFGEQWSWAQFLKLWRMLILEGVLVVLDIC